ncbi:MAG: penicillin-binding protein 2 [Anaerolineae bacterium]|nr:penicillin-binding protein 2 [Anaerolineae bacterium]
MITDDAPSDRFRRRVLVTAAGLTGLLLVLALQLMRLQVLERDALLAAPHPQAAPQFVYPRRGNIVDRTGRLMATDIYRWDIGVSPKVIPPAQQEELAKDLAPLLGQPADAILAKMRAKPDAVYTLLAKDVDEVTGERIAQLKTDKWACLSADPHPKRYYPQGNLAAHVLGFVNGEGKAFYGVEEFYQEFLKGASVLRSVPVSDEALPDTFTPYIPSPVERDLVLTIDSAIQLVVEGELKHAVEYYGARSGTVIVQDPKTGEILAMANEPSFDPNHYYEASKSKWINRNVSWPYEPGSVVKVLTLAAGLDSGAITLDQTFIDNGVLVVGGREIRNFDRRGHGKITLVDILAKSLNVGAAQVSLAMGPETFYRYLRRFGFGRATEVDLAGEQPGIVKNPDSPVWSESDLATNAYGQGLTVTPLQLITAVSAIANDGVPMHPHVVRMMVDHGRVARVHPRPYPRAIKAETARHMRQIMAEATARGLGADLVPGYKVAGKTGTAQVPTPTGYSENETIVTYVAFLPADDPRVTILVKLDRPTRSIWATHVAVPVFQDIASQVVRILHIPPSETQPSRE